MNSYQVSPPVAEGDQIKYLMSDGRKGEMVIQAVNTHALIGQNGLQLPLDQIVTLERKETSPGKTAMATGAGIGAGAIIVVTILSIGLVSALIAAG
ncbi:hypothetical protein CIG19_21140 [Enterobacterales bacterium CwR94]|nr:hypothetical protein CIG19_21140 [Enterobacterales bacterium CwR94]